MENEKFQELVLQQLRILTEGQKELVIGQQEFEQIQNQLLKGQKELEKGQNELVRGQKELEKGQKELVEGQQDIKNQLKHIWEDINRLDTRICKIDDRLSKQEDETAYLKLLK